MIIDLEKLGNYDFRLSNINIFHQKPVYREVNQRYRNYNGFLYIIHGKCRYFYGDECFTLIPGSVVYLPISSNHRMIVDSPEIEFYRIDFGWKLTKNLYFFPKHRLNCVIRLRRNWRRRFKHWQIAINLSRIQLQKQN